MSHEYENVSLMNDGSSSRERPDSVMKTVAPESGLLTSAEPGQAVYTWRTLPLYDLWVLGISNRFIWKCPTGRLKAHYDCHVSANHLDVGVGSGYFLDHCHFPSVHPRLALMDLNPNSLDFVSQRVARYAPEVYRRNVLEPIPFEEPGFDSIGINYLMHCLPGTMSTKAVIFDHLRELMNPGAVLFGSTVLQGGVPRNVLARWLMSAYNRWGIFSNRHDDLDVLRDELSRRFRDVSVEVMGCTAFFSGRV